MWDSIHRYVSPLPSSGLPLREIYEAPNQTASRCLFPSRALPFATIVLLVGGMGACPTALFSPTLSLSNIAPRPISPRDAAPHLIKIVAAIASVDLFLLRKEEHLRCRNTLKLPARTPITSHHTG
jgi:hypothetical protein